MSLFVTTILPNYFLCLLYTPGQESIFCPNSQVKSMKYFYAQNFQMILTTIADDTELNWFTVNCSQLTRLAKIVGFDQVAIIVRDRIRKAWDVLSTADLI